MDLINVMAIPKNQKDKYVSIMLYRTPIIDGYEICYEHPQMSKENISVKSESNKIMITLQLTAAKRKNNEHNEFIIPINIKKFDISNMSYEIRQKRLFITIPKKSKKES